MTKMEKNQLYDDICDVLNEYESEGDEVEQIPNYVAMDLYDVLVKVASRWEELTGEEMQ